MDQAYTVQESRLSQEERSALAALLFPHIDKTPDAYEGIYPPRDLPQGAFVTRFSPSPTGFVHLGNLYSALVDERMAHLSGGVVMLRVEDTDNKREIPGAVELLISSLAYFGVEFDEGATGEGDIGAYGPYRQRMRVELYQTMACHLIRMGRAYPCFCTEEELNEIRDTQTKRKENPGYYGSWARHRDLTMEEIKTKHDAGEPFVVRLRSMGDASQSFTMHDGIRGALTMPENDQDFVLLKADGIPTYHFAHAVDDHFMRTTHVVRGDEWLATLPYHRELFQTLGYPPPVYCHTATLMKMDGESKRKISKRLDPEAGLGFYNDLGYLPQAVRSYLLTVLNSNYEEWQRANPDQPYTAFPFSAEKMSASGALFDLEKLNSVSKDILATMTGEEVYHYLEAWSASQDQAAHALLTEDPASAIAALNIGRGGNNPRKDLVYGKQIMAFISFFFDAVFAQEDPYPEQIPAELAVALLEGYLATYDFTEDNAAWFAKVRDLGAAHGFAARPKDYQQDPEAYKGHVGDVSALLRVALTGRQNAPDLWEVQQVLGEERSRGRVRKAIDQIRANERTQGT
ncbi:MAG: glutamate--tRNA ligase [Clostridiales bacterium]|nr:glutamate--tRNA ligase [Clostridiales bacterium]